MGCCGVRIEDPDIKHADTIEALINVMKEKREKAIEEQKQIQAHLADNTVKITTSNIDGLSKDDLERRVPYLGILSNYFKEAVDLLVENQKIVSLGETKEHMYNIYDHFLRSTEPEEHIKTDMAKFKAYVFELSRKK